MPNFKFTNIKEFGSSYIHEKDTEDIVQDIAPIGTTMLYATMKQGKSLLGLSEALSVANTNVDTWLDLKIKNGNVLYFGLDDSDKVLNERLNKYCDNLPNFYVVNSKTYREYCSTLNGMSNGNKFNTIVNDFISQHGSVSLVIADTFEKIRFNKDRTYNSEVEEVSILKQNAQYYRYNLLLIHHATKFKDGNLFEFFYGSNGLGAEVDVLMTLQDSGDSDYQYLYARGNAFEDKKLLIHRSDDLKYELASINEADLVEDFPDKSYLKILKYFTKQRNTIIDNSECFTYQGEYQDFIQTLDLDIDSRGLGKLLKKYEQRLNEQHIYFNTKHLRNGMHLTMIIPANMNDNVSFFEDGTFIIEKIEEPLGD